MKLHSAIVTWSGLFVIVAGVGLIVVQDGLQYADFAASPSTRTLQVTAPDLSANLSTTYVGLVLVAIGAILELAAMIASREKQRAPAHGTDVS
jgi:uncharacterized membrane protein